MTTQAGWYPDPQDRSLERWWDGQQWTPATRGVSGGPVAAPRSNGPLLVVVGAVLVLAGLIVWKGAVAQEFIEKRLEMTLIAFLIFITGGVFAAKYLF